jgi:hypothetical protein
MTNNKVKPSAEARLMYKDRGQRRNLSFISAVLPITPKASYSYYMSLLCTIGYKQKVE